VRCGLTLPCRVGCHAAWDTVPHGIPCRVGRHAARDAMPRGTRRSRRAHRAVRSARLRRAPDISVNVHFSSSARNPLERRRRSWRTSPRLCRPTGTAGHTRVLCDSVRSVARPWPLQLRTEARTGRPLLFLRPVMRACDWLWLSGWHWLAAASWRASACDNQRLSLAALRAQASALRCA